ncbi:hypothetical protein PS631_00263 [Pseudomonas fluorescens]|uniref:Uncharacterized protein n=1 Tax=Pseudomonas fluorescens TaxID=294 RepID=A0A5E6PGA2_PSEFL|nr:phage tail protein [Pseudomonas fluorescens]VVM40634.1 hypothetical protein PS631_00263 [Pseudomonas fluorescens]
MPWYRVGTVAITAGQTTVTGTGTNFPANSRVGDAFQGPDGRWYEVTNIASATVISILPAYLGATVAAGTYGLAPMQGYVKESADRLRQLVDQFGATLAGLGSVSTENVVPLAKGGTGGTTPALARAGLQLGSAAVAAILGTVSQAGGMPTGAIMEAGSNANGEYLKYADGTLITRSLYSDVGLAINNAAGVLFRSATLTQLYPASFFDRPKVSTNMYKGVNDIYRLSAQQHPSGSGYMTFSVSSSVSSAAVAIECSVIAIGRWF